MHEVIVRIKEWMSLSNKLQFASCSFEKHHLQKQPGEEWVYFNYRFQSITKRSRAKSQGREESRDRNRSRDHGGTVLTVLLSYLPYTGQARLSSDDTAHNRLVCTASVCNQEEKSFPCAQGPIWWRWLLVCVPLPRSVKLTTKNIYITTLISLYLVLILFYKMKTREI